MVCQICLRCLKRNLADKFRRFALLFGLFLKFKKRGKFLSVLPNLIYGRLRLEFGDDGVAKINFGFRTGRLRGSLNLSTNLRPRGCEIASNLPLKFKLNLKP